MVWVFLCCVLFSEAEEYSNRVFSPFCSTKLTTQMFLRQTFSTQTPLHHLTQTFNNIDFTKEVLIFSYLSRKNVNSYAVLYPDWSEDIRETRWLRHYPLLDQLLLVRERTFEIMQSSSLGLENLLSVTAEKGGTYCVV